MDKARINKLYKRLENVGLFQETNLLLWTFTSGAAREAYAEGKADGFKAGFEAGYAKAME